METISLAVERDFDHFAEEFIGWFSEQRCLVKPNVKVWLIPTRTEWRKLVSLADVVIRNKVENKTKPQLIQTDGLLLSQKLFIRVKEGLTPTQQKIAEKQMRAIKATVNEFFAGKDYAIFLNLQFLQQQSKHKNLQFDSLTKYVLTHELLHAFEHENNMIIITSHNDDRVSEILEKFTTANPKWV
jgi:hypothetical protein